MQEETCKRCGLRLKSSPEFCPACGNEFGRDSTTYSEYNTHNYNPSNSTDKQTHQNGSNVIDVSFVEILNNKIDLNQNKALINQQGDYCSENFIKIWSKNNLLDSLGWRKLVGTIIVSEPPYMTKPISHWTVKSLKISLWIFFFPIIIAILIVAMIGSFLFSFLSFGSKGGRPGFISGISNQVIGFFLTGKLFGPKEQIPVRDVRIRDKNGNEHLIRIAGELIAGNFNVGDEIEAQGFDRKGTLVFYRGRNYRTGSEIIIKKK